MTGPAVPAGTPVIAAVVPVTAVTVPAGLARRQIIGRGCLLLGWSLVNTSADTAATVTFRDGGSADGQPLSVVVVPAAGSVVVALAPAGITVVSSLWVDDTSGTVSGSVWACL